MLEVPILDALPVDEPVAYVLPADEPPRRRQQIDERVDYVPHSSPLLPLVCGILALVLSCVPLLGGLLAIVAVIHARAKKMNLPDEPEYESTRSTLSSALILGLVGVWVNLVVFVGAIVFVRG